MRVRIAVFDNNSSSRDMIASLLNKEPMFEVAGIYPDLKNLIENVWKSRPDVVLMDIEMPRSGGIEAVKRLTKEFPHIQILIQTIFEDDNWIYEAFVAGASGYILKNYLKTSLLDAIHELRYGGSPMSPFVSRRVLYLLRHSKGPHSLDKSMPGRELTFREKEVLACIVEGLSHKMIAFNLNISYETVRSHTKKLYEKLCVASLTELVATAINHHIV